MVNGDKHASGELVPARTCNDYASYLVDTKFYPRDPNRSINCTILAQNPSVHDDGENRGQPELFPVI
jgi:hypothetical protein